MTLETWGWTPWSVTAAERGWNPPVAQYVPPLTAEMVRALVKARSTARPSGKTVQYESPTMDDARRYWQWAPDVRFGLLIVEVLSRWQVKTGTGAAEVTALKSGSWTKLIGLQQPTEQDIAGADGLPGTHRAYPADAVAIDELVAQDVELDVFMLRGVGQRPTPENGRRYELARAVSIVVNLVCQRLKHAFAVPRPHEVDGQIEPLLAVPGHSSFPGGHATMASALAVVLADVVPDAEYDKLDALARDIAINRVKAGLHYPLDSTAGHALGTTLAQDLKDTLATEPQALPLLHELWQEAKRS
jgi:hypothetical protein